MLVDLPLPVMPAKTTKPWAASQTRFRIGSGR